MRVCLVRTAFILQLCDADLNRGCRATLLPKRALPGCNTPPLFVPLSYTPCEIRLLYSHWESHNSTIVLSMRFKNHLKNYSLWDPGGEQDLYHEAWWHLFWCSRRVPSGTCGKNVNFATSPTWLCLTVKYQYQYCHEGAFAEIFLHHTSSCSTCSKLQHYWLCCFRLTVLTFSKDKLSFFILQLLLPIYVGSIKNQQPHMLPQCATFFFFFKSFVWYVKNPEVL